MTVGLVPNGALHTRVAGLVARSAQPIVVGFADAVSALATVGAWRYRHRIAAAGTAAWRLRVLAQPRRYLATVASWQLLAWALRVGALILLLDAFQVPSPARVAPIVLSLQLLAGSVPLTPGGAGTQQAVVAAAFGGGAIVAFSAGAQLGTMLVDVLVGLLAFAACAVRPRLQLLPTAAAPA